MCFICHASLGRNQVTWWSILYLLYQLQCTTNRLITAFIVPSLCLTFHQIPDYFPINLLCCFVLILSLPFWYLDELHKALHSLYINNSFAQPSLQDARWLFPLTLTSNQAKDSFGIYLWKLKKENAFTLQRWLFITHSRQISLKRVLNDSNLLIHVKPRKK